MIKLNLIAILIVMLSLPFLCRSQDLQLSPTFFSLRNSKFSIGLGFEGSTTSFMTNNSSPSDLGVQYRDPRKTDNSYPFLSGGLVFDLYSDNSLIGFLAGANYSELTTTYFTNNVSTDYFTIGRVEFPFYIKIRPGFVGSKNHVWFLLGAIYSIPVTVQREHDVINPNSVADVSYTDPTLAQANSTISVSTSLGYEAYLTTSKSTRGAIFLTATYPISNQFNSSYPEFMPGGRSVFGNYPSFDIRDLRVSFGIKYLYKLGKSKL